MPVFYAGHADAGMVNVARRPCAHQGCSSGASFGVAGTKKREFCSAHALPGMITFTTKCASNGCQVLPVFGVSGSGRLEFCSVHAAASMVNLNRKVCTHSECARMRYPRRGWKQGAGVLHRARPERGDQPQREALHAPRVLHAILLRRAGQP